MCMLTLSVPQVARLSKLERQLSTLCISYLMLTNGATNTDGYGMITNTGSLQKAPTPAVDYFQTPAASDWLLSNITQPLIGHVRTASTGLKAKDTAHPFLVGALAMCHNGTITNYRALLEDVKEVVQDSNPVDTHVVAAMLAAEVGEGTLNEEHLKTTLEKLYGSYSFIILDQTVKNVWVVVGSNPLYLQTQGPLLLVNTSGTNLEAVAEMVSHTAGVFDYAWQADTPTKLNAQTAYRLAPSRQLEKVCVLPIAKRQTTTYYTSHPYFSNYTRPASEPEVLTADRARVFVEITQIPNVDKLEAEMACLILFGERWTSLSPEVLTAIRATLENIYADHATEEKLAVWDSILALDPSTPYTAVSNLTEFDFPWPLNDLDTLAKAFLLLHEQKTDSNTPMDRVTVNLLLEGSQ